MPLSEGDCPANLKNINDEPNVAQIPLPRSGSVQHRAGANGHCPLSFGLSREKWMSLLHSEPGRRWPWLSFGSLGGMSIAKKFIGFCIGAAIGICIAIYFVIAGNDQEGFGRAVLLAERPVLIVAQWLFGKLTFGVAMVSHFGFFIVVGGLLGLGVVTLFSKITSDD